MYFVEHAQFLMTAEISWSSNELPSQKIVGAQRQQYFVSHLFVDNIVVHSVELRRIMEMLDVSFQAKI